MTQSDHKQPIIVCYAIENHPCDSRVTVDENGIVQTLNARMGTGGGNTPMILMALGGTDMNASVTDGTIAPCILARAGTGGGNEPIILEVRDESISKEHRSLVCEDGQRPVRPGRIQRHDPCDRERNA